ncbi:mitochondrial coenzyme A diphosphatase NUDT8 [Aphomia sociella]
MSFTPNAILTNAVRERCLANFKELPGFFVKEEKPDKIASVLVPLCVDNEEVCLLYTLRSSNLKSHRGQVSFPGGKLDNNESIIDAALRETEEEIGVDRNDIDVWGEMPQVTGRDNSLLISPVVGLIKNFSMNNLHPNIDEVEEIFYVPLSSLCNRKYHGCFQFNNISLPIYFHEKFKIWGITGLITHFFLQSLLPETLYNFDFKSKKYTLDELMPSKL